MPRSGAYKNYLDFQQNTVNSPYTDPEGEPTKSWIHFAYAYGSIQPQGGRELFAASAEERQALILIRCRYFSGLTGDMRIVHGGKYYNIKNIINVDNGDFEYLLACEEGVNLG